MRKYEDFEAKEMSIDTFIGRNHVNLPGYFDELVENADKLRELTLLYR
eukprot:UN20950